MHTISPKSGGGIFTLTVGESMKIMFVWRRGDPLNTINSYDNLDSDTILRLKIVLPMFLSSLYMLRN